MNAPVRTPVILTDDQYEDMARRGAFERVGRVELRGGVVVPMSPVFLNHSNACGALFSAFRQSVLTSRSSLKVNGEISVRFGRAFQPTADLVVWDASGVPVDHAGPIPGEAVKLVVEVAAASLADDLGQKLLDYAAAGLTEYWVADVGARVIHRCVEPYAEGYRRRDVVRFGEAAACLTLPLAIETDTL